MSALIKTDENRGSMPKKKQDLGSPHKITAPYIDSLLKEFEYGSYESGFPLAPRERYLQYLTPLFSELRDLVPCREDHESRAILVEVPRGDITDFGSFEEYREWGRVNTFEEFVDLWKEKYPEETVWYEIIVKEVQNLHFERWTLWFRMEMIAKIDLALDPAADPNDFCFDEPRVELCRIAAELVKKSMDMVRAGTFGAYLEENLPCWNKVGVIRRKVLWEAFPEEKERVLKGLSDREFFRFRQLIESGENEPEKLNRIQRFTANDFFRACSIGYRACGYDVEGMSLVDQYLRYSDGRDNGLTGRGGDFYAGNGGIDPDDPDAWDQWFWDPSCTGGHPWEMGYVSLFVKNDGAGSPCGSRTEQEGRHQYLHPPEKGVPGYYFLVRGAASNNAVKFYIAIHDAGFPVLLDEGIQILEQLKGEGYVGFVPRRMYREDIPGMYGKARYGNRRRLTKEIYEAVGDQIRWMPLEEPVLCTAGHNTGQ